MHVAPPYIYKQAQLVSSNAGENPPFQLKVFDPDYPDDDKFILNKNFIIEEEKAWDGSGIKRLVVPKKVIGQIQLASWERTVVKRFMPVVSLTYLSLTPNPNSTFINMPHLFLLVLHL